MFLEKLPQDLQRVVREYKADLDKDPTQAVNQLGTFVPEMTRMIAACKAKENGDSIVAFMGEAKIVAEKIFIGLSEVIGVASQAQLQAAWDDLERREQQLELSSPSGSRRH
jgi:hypothetical protein